MPSVLITGSSRGVGLEFARQYAGDGWRVFATCRDPGASEALAQLAAEAGGRVSTHRLDVRDRGQAEALAADLGDTPLDILINNAGIIGSRPRGLGEVDDRVWLDTLDTNVIGPLRVVEALVDNVAAGERKLIVTLSSIMGSIGQNSRGGDYDYRSSKAGVNAVVKSLSIDLAPRGIVCVCFHPGWVRTDMGGAGATVSPADSVAGMRRVIEGLGAEDNGRFFNYDGDAILW